MTAEPTESGTDADALGDAVDRPVAGTAVERVPTAHVADADREESRDE